MGIAFFFTQGQAVFVFKRFRYHYRVVETFSEFGSTQDQLEHDYLETAI